MSGHSKWAQIKHKKALTDTKKSRLFSQLARAITLVAREKGADPAVNPTLRTAIENAQSVNMSKETIQRAVQKAASSEELLTRVLYEAYGPGGVALIIEGITDNNNRTFNEVRKILDDHHAKMAPGSASWAFVKEGDTWKAKTTIDVDEENKKKVENLVDALEEHDDVQSVYTNISSGD